MLLNVNGAQHPADAAEDTALVHVLRNQLGLKGTRVGCGVDQCGACYVLLDDRAVPACDTPLWAAAGKRITTIEGLGTAGQPHPLQSAFIAEQAAQCGYCSSGILITSAALLLRNPAPAESEVREALDRHLCRCGTHNRIVRAVLRAAREMRSAGPR